MAATVLIVELAHSGIHWMAPGDIELDNLPESFVEGTEGNGFWAVFADSPIKVPTAPSTTPPPMSP